MYNPDVGNAEEFDVDYSEGFFTSPIPAVETPSDNPSVTPIAETDTPDNIVENTPGLEDWPEGHPMKASQDKRRYEYWQSQHSKLNNEYSALKQQLAQVEPVLPVARFLQENPQVIQALDSYLKQGNQPAPVQPTAQPPEVQLPVKPIKPADYSEADMFDPNTNTYKYLAAERDYELALIRHERETMKKEQESYKQFMEEQKALVANERKNSQLQAILTTQHGLSKEQVGEFISEMDSPASIELDTLVEFWKFRKGLLKNSGTPSLVPNRVQELQTQLRNKQKTGTIAGSPGENAPQYDEDDMFNLSLIEAGKKGRFF